MKGKDDKLVQTIETDNIHAAHTAHGNGHDVFDQLHGDKTYEKHLDEVEAKRAGK